MHYVFRDILPLFAVCDIPLSIIRFKKYTKVLYFFTCVVSVMEINSLMYQRNLYVLPANEHTHRGILGYRFRNIRRFDRVMRNWSRGGGSNIYAYDGVVTSLAK